MAFGGISKAEPNTVFAVVHQSLPILRVAYVAYGQFVVQEMPYFVSVYIFPEQIWLLKQTLPLILKESYASLELILTHCYSYS
jgi:hypothetical protein